MEKHLQNISQATIEAQERGRLLAEQARSKVKIQLPKKGKTDQAEIDNAVARAQATEKQNAFGGQE